MPPTALMPKRMGLKSSSMIHARIARIPVIAPPAEIMLTIQPQGLVVPSSMILEGASDLNGWFDEWRGLKN